ncbi:hypothetical protein MMC24_007583 [Lignoscripta atroalba]|nr:hypothetical protein [Lignoscripta atroalba]
MPYTPSPSQPPYPHPYHSYQPPHPQAHHPLPQHFHPQQPPQWYQYQHMQVPIPRPYQQYPTMVASPYPIPQNASSMLQSPNPPQHIPSSSSIRSHQSMLSPSPSNPSLHVPSPTPASASSRLSPPPAPPPPIRRMPYYPPLPWYSVSEEDFPAKGLRRRRRRPPIPLSNSAVELPPRTDSVTSENTIAEQTLPVSDISVPAEVPLPVAAQSGSATPTTSQAQSEADSTQPTTPSSAVAPQMPARQQTGTDPKSFRRSAGKVLPVVPVVPNIPSLSRPSGRKSTSLVSGIIKSIEPQLNGEAAVKPTVENDQEPAADIGSTTSDRTSKASSPIVKPTPKSWADLVRTKGPSAASVKNPVNDPKTQSNRMLVSKSGSLSDILALYDVDNNAGEAKFSFLEPRGLVNTGNMCYMNAVLQVLVFCTPFYDFLDRIGKQAAYSFKSDTPLLDAMIMFVREFPVIDSAVSVEQLRMRLKDSELEQYGEAFIPEFVYEIIRRLPRFSTMRRGHQQDAQEFLGFLLEEMHDECAKAMKAATTVSDISAISSPSTETDVADDLGWLEVGPRQKAAVTRSSGTIATESPITKIFGGKLRSELRVPGAKNSVTLEPYQPLQLDIGSLQVNNITDALKGLTRSETLHGDFNSPRGPGVSATKQVFIETLPPVLILHLKRFQYDNAGGTQKIWKKIGYPLELEIPKEVFPQHKRGGLVAHGGLPKYRLIGVVYHHGRNASGGHYTVDVRRQDGREWIRLDDTVIRRVRSEDVAEGGSEEDPKVLAAALEQHKRDQSTSGTIYDQVGEREDEEDKLQSERGWNQVNGAISASTAADKKWSGVVNGTATPTTSSGKRTPVGPSFSVKDNKVAYLLFYQKLGA